MILRCDKCGRILEVPDAIWEDKLYKLGWVLEFPFMYCSKLCGLIHRVKLDNEDLITNKTLKQ